MINNLPYIIKIKLVDIFNNFFLNNTIPSSWSAHKVVMVPIPNKDPQLVSSYRPITSSSCVGKVFEIMIKNRLEWWLESSDKLAESQFGFRQGKSTLDTLTILYNNILSSFLNKEYTTALFLDIKIAYDNVNINILIEKLKDLKFPKKDH